MSIPRNKALSAAAALALSIGASAPATADHVSAADTQALQTRPIPLGGSGSSQTLLQIRNLLYCYTGTLGALVEDAAHRQYVLSNNHVLAKENETLAYGSAADNATIIQPGLLDEGTCSLSLGDPTHAVADLSSYVPILFGKGKNKPSNTVDAAIAEARDGEVDTAGAILGIGVLDGTPVEASVGLAVQKTGRTTGHTFGTIRAVGVTIDVSYESGTARFVDQLRIRKPCDDAGFSDAGDSGSLIVTAPAPGSEPAAVGLLFAGGGSDTFANPIDAVLAATGTQMVAGVDGDTEGAMLADQQAIASSCSTSSGGGGHPPRRRDLSAALDAASVHSADLFALPDVVGHGVGADASGNPVIEVYTQSRARRAAGRAYPTEIEGIPVRVIETGQIRAYRTGI
jgi:hypothetical protein